MALASVEQWFPGKCIDGVEEFPADSPEKYLYGRAIVTGGLEYVMPGDWLATTTDGERLIIKSASLQWS